jgi:hypothetical protein
MKTLVGLLAVIGAVAAGCGSDDAPSVEPLDSAGADTVVDDGAGEDAAPVATDGDSSGDAPEPVGPADMNTIRIGSQVWERTLPMTTGQCFVQNVEGLPPSGTAWGTLDGDDGIRFSAGQNQDGTNEAEVDDQENFYWIAGPRSSGPDDLEIELDFEALTITGQGTFTNVFTGDTAAGSFAFQCEDDGSGS